VHEPVERQPGRVQRDRAQRRVELAEAQFQERVLPFDVEEHRGLDVHQDRLAGRADQHVVAADLAVDEAVPGSGSHGGEAGLQLALERVVSGGDARIPRGRRDQGVQAALPGEAGRGLAREAERGRLVGVHLAEHLTEPVQGFLAGDRVALQQLLQRAAADVLDQRAVRGQRDDFRYANPGLAEQRVRAGEVVGAGPTPERPEVEPGLGRPEVLVGGPAVQQHGGPVVQGDPVDALGAAAGEPAQVAQPPVAAVRVLDELVHVGRGDEGAHGSAGYRVTPGANGACRPHP
jgi:hypothetical protein